jgi:hypothetical protein
MGSRASFLVSVTNIDPNKDCPIAVNFAGIGQNILDAPSCFPRVNAAAKRRAVRGVPFPASGGWNADCSSGSKRGLRRRASVFIDHDCLHTANTLHP